MPDVADQLAPWRVPKPGRLVRLWPRVRPYRGLLLGATVALVLSSMASLAFPMAVRFLLDAAFVSRDRALLDRIALGLVALFSVQAVLNVYTKFARADGHMIYAHADHGEVHAAAYPGLDHGDRARLRLGDRGQGRSRRGPVGSADRAAPLLQRPATTRPGRAGRPGPDHGPDADRQVRSLTAGY